MSHAASYPAHNGGLVDALARRAVVFQGIGVLSVRNNESTAAATARLMSLAEQSGVDTVLLADAIVTSCATGLGRGPERWGAFFE